MPDKLKKTVSSTRFYRKLHKWLAVPLFLLMFLIGVTGFFLGWKKQTSLLPRTQKGSNMEMQSWLSLAELTSIAQHFAADSLHKSTAIDRIDVRPQKGVAKVIFENHFNELQIDLATGEIVSSRLKTSDIIEKLHDGSIVDYFIRIDQDPFKLAYTTSASIGLILLSVSGFWMWYNPKRIRKLKKDRNQ